LKNLWLVGFFFLKKELYLEGKNIGDRGGIGMKDILIRHATEQDAEQVISHIRQVLKENADFMATTLEEFNPSVEEEREWIRLHSERGLMLVAEYQGRLIGLLNLQLSAKEKFKHQGMFGMSIQEIFTGKGIGTCLILEMLEWAKQRGDIEKISLEVFSNNKRAIHLYTKMGFKEEGRRIKQAKLRPGEYVDDILMSIFI